MGKPIAGKGQYPYSVGGILTNGAKIDGEIYIKSLYIYKQRSYDIYDLIDESGNIYEFMTMVYKNSDNLVLDYNDIDVNLSSSLKDRTFYIKEQDPTYGIYGFSTLYQYNKIKVNTGDYIFKNTDENDYSLLAVKLTPNDVILEIGKTITINSSYIPSDYISTGGEWYFTDTTKVSSTADEKIDTITITGVSVGKTVVAYTPNENKTLTAMVNIQVIPAKTSELVSITGVVEDDRPTPCYALGEEFTLNLITEPFNFKLPKCNITGIANDYIELVNVSDDNKQYTFKIISNKDAKPYGSLNTSLRFEPPGMEFDVNGIIYTVSQYTFYVQIVTKSALKNLFIPQIFVDFGSTTQLKATYDKNLYYPAGGDISSWMVVPFTGSTDNGTLEQTSWLTANYTAPSAPDSQLYRQISITYNGSSYSSYVFFKFPSPESVYIEPFEITSLKKGKTLQLNPVFTPSDYPINPNNKYSIVQGTSSQISISNTGLFGVNNNGWAAKVNTVVGIGYGYLYNDTIAYNKTYYDTVRKYFVINVTDEDPTALYTIPANAVFGRIGEEFTLRVIQTPLTSTNKNISFEFSNDSIVEYDEQRLKYELMDNWGGGNNGSTLPLKGLNGGSTTLKIWYTDFPDVSTIINITVY